MGATRMVRKHASVLPWLRALVFFLATMAALGALPFYPPALRVLIGVVCSALAVFAPAIGVLALVLVLTVPLAAGNLIAGVLFMLVGLASVGYLGQDGARAFVVVALAFVATLVRAEWALAPLAGYVLGASEGGVAVLVGVAAVEAAGILLGKPSTGALVTGGGTALVNPGALAAIKDPLSFGWLAVAASRIDADVLLKAFSSVRDVPLLVVQPVLWGVAAALGGGFAKRDAPVRSLAAVVAGTVALAVASIVAVTSLHGPVLGTTMGATAVVSLVVAAAGAGLFGWVFPLVAPAEAGRLPSMRTEDAEVDELLRMIADAEEALEDRHASDSVVMITDMKSFSRMTQEQGTMATAKVIQKHRDLLLPIVSAAGGHGKSTGGDGLVAAFPSAEEALRAAVAMQNALKAYNDKKSPDKQIHVRMGIASGDVICDRAGCPFIGDGLNLAARVMNLADGGQVFAAGDVIDAASDLPSPVVSHGTFDLKNISHAVDVYEVLWDEGQQPKRPEQAQPPAA